MVISYLFWGIIFDEFGSLLMFIPREFNTCFVIFFFLYCRLGRSFEIRVIRSILNEILSRRNFSRFRLFENREGRVSRSFLANGTKIPTFDEFTIYNC